MSDTTIQWTCGFGTTPSGTEAHEMADLVGTCPKDFWEEWIAEGDAAGEVETGEDWHWYTRHSLARDINPGDRFYVVARGKLRGWAPVVRVEVIDYRSYAIVRKGGAVACTIAEPIPGFRGLRLRWWRQEDELPFPNWRDENGDLGDLQPTQGERNGGGE